MPKAMRRPMPCFRRRILLGIILLFSVSMVFTNFGLSVQRFFEQVLTSGTSDAVQPILHKIKNEDPSDVLRSAIYASNKTNFEDAFPPNTKRTLTLDTKFVIGNFDICKDTDRVAYIVVVHSAVNHLKRRQRIRSTWGMKNLIQGLPSTTIFLLGQIEDAIANDALLKENDLYGDIIQGQFVDNHQNMTLKNVMGLRWVSNHCSNAKFVIKVDDDVFVDIFKARRLYFNNLETSPKQIICKVGTNNRIFRKKNWPPGEPSTVSDDYFKNMSHYPMPWCFGFVVFMSMDLAVELYRAALVTPSYPLDDVYVYGILPSTIKGVTWRNEEERFSKEEKETLSNWGCIPKQPFVVGTFWSDNVAQQLWNTTLKCLP